MERVNNCGDMFFFLLLWCHQTRLTNFVFIMIYKCRLLIVVIVIVEHTILIFKTFPLENYTPSTGQNCWLIIRLQLPI